MSKRLLLVIVGLIVLGGCVVYEEPHPPRAIVITPDMSPPVFTVKPVLVIVDGTADVYYVADTTVFFYSSSWYYYTGGNWFISVTYGGPWRYVEYERVPVAFKKIPPGHLKVPPGQMKKSAPPAAKPIPPGHQKDKGGKGKGKDK